MFRIQSDQHPISQGRERGPEWYDASFDQHPHWSQHYSQSRYYSLWGVISDRLGDPSRQSLLEIGCGAGQLAAMLRDRGWTDYCGVDFSPRRIAQARKVCPEFDFVLDDVFESDAISARRYEIAIATEFLEHVERDLLVLERLPRGTRFLGTVPNFPYPSHVRHFQSSDEVTERYSRLFQDLRVDTFPAEEAGKVFFLLDGLRA